MNPRRFDPSSLTFFKIPVVKRPIPIRPANPPVAAQETVSEQTTPWRDNFNQKISTQIVSVLKLTRDRIDISYGKDKRLPHLDTLLLGLKEKMDEIEMKSDQGRRDSEEVRRLKVGVQAMIQACFLNNTALEGEHKEWAKRFYMHDLNGLSWVCTDTFFKSQQGREEKNGESNSREKTIATATNRLVQFG